MSLEAPMVEVVEMLKDTKTDKAAKNLKPVKAGRDLLATGTVNRTRPPSSTPNILHCWPMIQAMANFPLRVDTQLFTHAATGFVCLEIHSSNSISNKARVGLF